MTYEKLDEFEVGFNGGLAEKVKEAYNAGFVDGLKFASDKRKE